MTDLTKRLSEATEGTRELDAREARDAVQSLAIEVALAEANQIDGQRVNWMDPASMADAGIDLLCGFAPLSAKATASPDTGEGG